MVEGHSGCPEGSAETIREMMEAEISWERARIERMAAGKFHEKFSFQKLLSDV